MALLNWHSLPQLDQTWSRFKSTFTTARKYLRKVRGKTMRSAGFHQANMVAENLDTVRNEVLAEVCHVQSIVTDTIAGIPQVDDNIQLPSPQI